MCYVCIEYSYYIINNIQRKINKKKKKTLEFDEELVEHTHISFVKVAYGELKRHFFFSFHGILNTALYSLLTMTSANTSSPFETSSSLCSFDLITLTALWLMKLNQERNKKKIVHRLNWEKESVRKFDLN